MSLIRPAQSHLYSTAHREPDRFRVRVMVGQTWDSSIFRLSLLRSEVGLIAGSVLPSQHSAVDSAQSRLKIIIKYQDSVSEFIARTLELYHPATTTSRFLAGNIHCF